MKRIDGAAIAQKVHGETKARIESLAASGWRPGLAVVLVGDDPASRTAERIASEIASISWTDFSTMTPGGNGSIAKLSIR